jgi:hypothetical protein
VSVVIHQRHVGIEITCFPSRCPLRPQLSANDRHHGVHQRIRQSEVTAQIPFLNQPGVPRHTTSNVVVLPSAQFSCDTHEATTVGDIRTTNSSPLAIEDSHLMLVVARAGDR